VPDPFNLLLMVADPVGNAAPIMEDVARSDLTNLWRDRVNNIDEVTTNLFLDGFDTEGDMMSIIRGQPWTLRSHNLLIEMMCLIEIEMTMLFSIWMLLSDCMAFLEISEQKIESKK